MGRYVEGQDRTQSVLFPERLDDWIHEDSTVRVIDVFVDELDLRKLSFERADPAATGRPGYSPATLLKIYVYGYLNRVQSSRRLETEAQRNLELIWLTGRLAPDFKTIADFRRDNGEAIRKVCKEFVLLCRRMKLFTDGIVAIDGSKFKAVSRVSSTCLVTAARNRYSVPCELARHTVSTRLYPTRVVIVSEERVVAEHQRQPGKGKTVYDWQHYVPLVQRKPGALRNGAPFMDLPEPLGRLRQALLKHAGGDRLMAQVLGLVKGSGLDAVLVAAELALERAGPSGRVSPEHVGNVLARLTAPPRPENVATALGALTKPLADTARYDRLRRIQAEPATEQGAADA